MKLSAALRNSDGRRSLLALCSAALALGIAALPPSLAAESHKAKSDLSRRVNASPVPGWVETLKPELEETVPLGASSDGSFYLLSDTQVSVEKESRFSHYAIKILSDAGVQSSSSVEADWDPSFQRLDFHFIRIIRAGQAQDRLKAENFKVIQREANLESYMFDGSLSAILFLEDVRKGDVIEYAYSVTGRNPVFGGSFSGSCGLAFGVPVARLRHRLVHPLARELNIKTVGMELEIERSVSGKEESLVWDLRDVKAVLAEDGLPAWYHPFAYAQQSEYDSWQDVSAWALSVFGPRMKAGSGVRALAKEFVSASQDREAAILAAIRFVQDEIRYLGIEIGAYSHTPNHPETVLTRRYGDCKDKALLLTMLLREMGAQAYPALVSTDSGSVLDEGLPSPYAFNHAVTVLVHEGRRIWVDPTVSSQRGGLSALYFPDYGRGLVLESVATGLSEIPRSEPGALSITEDFSLASASDEKDGLIVTTVFTGAEADDMRQRSSGESREAMAKDYLDYYSGRYPGIARSSDLEIADDESANVITLIERYALELGGKPGRRDQADFRAGDVSSYIRMPGNRERALPYALDGPIQVAQTIMIHPLSDYSYEKDDISIESDVFAFSYSSDYAGERLTLDWKLDLKADSVPADGIAAYYDKVDQALDYTEYSISFSGAGDGPVGNYPYYLCLILAAGLAALSGLLLVLRGFRLPFPRALSPDGVIGKAFGSRFEESSPWFALIAQCAIALLFAFDAFLSPAAGLEKFASLLAGGLFTADGLQAASFIAEGALEAAIAGFCLLSLLLYFNARRETASMYRLQAAIALVFVLIDLPIAHIVGSYGDTSIARKFLMGGLSLIQQFLAVPSLLLSRISKRYLVASGPLFGFEVRPSPEPEGDVNKEP